MRDRHEEAGAHDAPGGGVRGDGDHEPWGGERRTRQLARVLVWLGAVVVLGAVFTIVYVLAS